MIYDHFSIEKVDLETSDIHICSRKIVGRIFVHIGQTSYISRLMDSLSQFQEICRSNPEICYPWTFWELSRELFVKVTCLLKIPWFIELVNIWNRRQSTEKSSKKLRVWNNVRVTPSFLRRSLEKVAESQWESAARQARSAGHRGRHLDLRYEFPSCTCPWDILWSFHQNDWEN